MSTRWAGLVRQAGNSHLPNSLYDSSFLHHRRVLGLVAGLFLVQQRGVLENKVIFWILDKITLFSCGSLHHPLGNHVATVSLDCEDEYRAKRPCPLSFAVFAFFARQVQVVLAELDGGVIEAAQASGATFWDIVGVYLSEVFQTFDVTAVTLISLVGETAMAGAVGASGIGNVAIAYGFNRYNHDVMHLGDYHYHLDYLYNPVLGRFLTRD